MFLLLGITYCENFGTSPSLKFPVKASWHNGSVQVTQSILPKTNLFPWKYAFPIGRFIVQPFIFRGYVSFKEGNVNINGVFSGPTIVVLWFVPPSLRLVSALFQWRWSFQHFYVFQNQNMEKSISFMEVPHTPQEKNISGDSSSTLMSDPWESCQRINKNRPKWTGNFVENMLGPEERCRVVRSNLPISKRLQEDVASKKNVSTYFKNSTVTDL